MGKSRERPVHLQVLMLSLTPPVRLAPTVHVKGHDVAIVLHCPLLLLSDVWLILYGFYVLVGFFLFPIFFVAFIKTNSRAQWTEARADHVVSVKEEATSERPREDSGLLYSLTVHDTPSTTF